MEFFERIFWEDFFVRIFLGDFFGGTLRGILCLHFFWSAKLFENGIGKELIFLSRFWGNARTRI